MIDLGMPAVLKTCRKLAWATAMFALAMAATLETRAQPVDRPADYATRRAAMLDIITEHARVAAEVTGVPRIDPNVMAAMGAVPRHEFVPEALRPLAYSDGPLPVTAEQSIAQPYIVALMTHLAAVSPGDVVFETGTGAGYHAAVLSLIARHVVSVEVVAPLALAAAAKLKDLRYDNVTVLAADGYYGAPGHGPFDAMILKEAVDHVPPRLLAQLKPGGRLVMPLGPRQGPQSLTLIEKDADGAIHETRILPVIFTPLQGGERI